MPSATEPKKQKKYNKNNLKTKNCMIMFFFYFGVCCSKCSRSKTSTVLFFLSSSVCMIKKKYISYTFFCFVLSCKLPQLYVYFPALKSLIIFYYYFFVLLYNVLCLFFLVSSFLVSCLISKFI